MRKPYERPETVVIEIAPCYIFASSFVIDPNSKGDFNEDFVRERHDRGTWGNLWAYPNNTTSKITQ